MAATILAHLTCQDDIPVKFRGILSDIQAKNIGSMLATCVAAKKQAGKSALLYVASVTESGLGCPDPKNNVPLEQWSSWPEDLAKALFDATELRPEDLEDCVCMAVVIGGTRQIIVTTDMDAPDFSCAPPPKTSTNRRLIRYTATKCAACGKEATETTKMLVCSACRMARYCSKESQKSHWKLEHKIDCPEMRESV
jgi:hypothetical protein